MVWFLTIHKAILPTLLEAKEGQCWVQQSTTALPAVVNKSWAVWQINPARLPSGTSTTLNGLSLTPAPRGGECHVCTHPKRVSRISLESLLDCSMADQKNSLLAIPLDRVWGADPEPNTAYQPPCTLCPTWFSVACWQGFDPCVATTNSISNARCCCHCHCHSH